MNVSDSHYRIISGAPLIGEGNSVDSRAFINFLSQAGIKGKLFVADGPALYLGRLFHSRMSMSTRQTMNYAFNSEARRSSMAVMPLRWEMGRNVKKALRQNRDAKCFITAQSIMAEEAVGLSPDVPVVMFSSDVFGKFSFESQPTVRQNEIVHLVWNREALDMFKNKLKLKNVILTRFVDPINAFDSLDCNDLPYQENIDGHSYCFVKLSGSGGDPDIVNAAIKSLWQKSKLRSIVFPGTGETGKGIIKAVSSGVEVGISLDSGEYYNYARAMTDRHYILAFPSEQVKHMLVLAQNGNCPGVAWLPPRGQHELLNLAWAVRKGMSGTVCIPREYHGRLREYLFAHGVSPADLECVEPENLCVEHFKPAPAWDHEAEALPLDEVIRKVAGINKEPGEQL